MPFSLSNTRHDVFRTERSYSITKKPKEVLHERKSKIHYEEWELNTNLGIDIVSKLWIKIDTDTSFPAQV